MLFGTFSPFYNIPAASNHQRIILLFLAFRFARFMFSLHIFKYTLYICIHVYAYDGLTAGGGTVRMHSTILIIIYSFNLALI